MGLHNPHDYTETDGACCCPSYYNYIYCADCERWMYNDLTFREDKPEDGLAEDVIRFAKQRAGK